MPDYYSVEAASADGGGSFTFPVGTIFPPRLTVTYNPETGRKEKMLRVIGLEGVYNKSTRQANFDAYSALEDFVASAGRVAVDIKFGGTVQRSYVVSDRGPRLNNLRLIQKGGSFSVNAFFAVDLEVPQNYDDGLGRTTRAKTQERYDGRLLATSWAVSVTGKNAKTRLLKFKPKDDAGPLEEIAVQQVDTETWQATWKITSPHSVNEYLLWTREIAIVEGGNPIEEVRILAASDGTRKGPILRRMPAVAWQVADVNRIQTLKRWIAKAPKLKPLLPKQFRDPTRSNTVSPWLPSPEGAIRGVMHREYRDFYLCDDEGVVRKAIADAKTPDVAKIKEPKDPKDWEKLR